MTSLSFDPMVHDYDATRTYDGANFSAAVAYLVERFPPFAFPRLLEPGIGTGRIAVPLAAQGYAVWGVDIAAQIFAVLQQRAAHAARPVRLAAAQADVCHLPFHASVLIRRSPMSALGPIRLPLWSRCLFTPRSSDGWKRTCWSSTVV
jgi:SAM-dependent methyltransferase